MQALGFVNFYEIKDRSSDAEGFDGSLGKGLLSQDEIQDIISMRLKTGWRWRGGGYRCDGKYVRYMNCSGVALINLTEIMYSGGRLLVILGFVKEKVVNPGRKDPPAGHNFDEIKKGSRRRKFEFETSYGGDDMVASSRDLISLRLYSSEKAGVIGRVLVVKDVNGFVEAVVNLIEIKLTGEGVVLFCVVL